ncbi:MAG: helix-turn-helix domain-containing protein [Vicinamibacterales bacterium]
MRVTSTLRDVGSDYRRRIGERLILARMAAKLSVAEVARRAGIDRGTVESAEGQGNVGVGYLERHAEALGLSLERVCSEALKVQPKPDLDVDEQLILMAYQRGSVAQRDALRALARTFAADATPAPQGSASGPDAGPQAEPGSARRGRRVRGRG